MHGESRFEKDRQKKDDGRYIIFYTFEDDEEDEKPEGAEEGGEG